METVLISSVLYLINIVISLSISLTVIHRLYIIKKFSKENDFHLYNDLFSWEMFFILIGIANILTIIMITTQFPEVLSIIFFKILICILISSFWGKIIHLEKVMNKITYEKHVKVGGFQCIFIIIILLLDLPYFILLCVLFLGGDYHW